MEKLQWSLQLPVGNMLKLIGRCSWMHLKKEKWSFRFQILTCLASSVTVSCFQETSFSSCCIRDTESVAALWDRLISSFKSWFYNTEIRYELIGIWHTESVAALWNRLILFFNQIFFARILRSHLCVCYLVSSAFRLTSKMSKHNAGF